MMTLRSETACIWSRRGRILEGSEGGWGGYVVGDPCLVRDEEAGGWRLFLFLLPPGHGQAFTSGDPCDASGWSPAGPLSFTNEEALGGRTVFKPFVVLDALRPSMPARFGDLYCLLVVADHDAKEVRRAWSRSLAGPWTLEREALIARGSGSDFDAKHVDAVSAFVFEDRNEVVYYYMGYPKEPQRHATSPLGSSQGAATEPLASALGCAAATMRGEDARAELTRRGIVLAPSESAGHWASGWVGGLQILPGSELRWPGLRHRWIGIVNASPTAPRSDDDSISREEPPPSLGGFAVCDEELPVGGWRWTDEPIERIDDVPPDAAQAGERRNFWRHFALPMPGGALAVFYNAGDYFQEKLFLRIGRPR